MNETESVKSIMSQQSLPQPCCMSAGMREHRSQASLHTPAMHAAAPHREHAASLNSMAFMATVHCLIGCTVGEVLGMVIGTALGWSNWPTVGLAVVLAFLFGYGMTLWPLRRAGMAWTAALGLAFASDTLSMTTMELVDNVIMVLVPGAMQTGLSDPVFWTVLGLSLLLAGVAAFPVNRWLIARGRGHALVHGQCH
jgi:hypothetical protein